MKVLDGPLGPGWAASAGIRHRLVALIALVALVALFAVACGGGDDDGNGSTGAATGGGSASTGASGPAGTGSSAGTSGSDSQPTGASTGDSGSSGSQDLENITDLAALKSFRWNVTLKGIGAGLAQSVPGANVDGAQFSAKGAYIAPDQAQVTIGTAGIEYKQTIKGDQQWTTVAGVTTGPMPATSAATDLIYVSTFVDPASVASSGGMNCGKTENVNGVAAVRCETTDEINQQIVGGLAPGGVASEAEYVIWVAKDGNFIVRWEFNAKGTANDSPFEWNFEANIMEVNNVSSIEP